VLMPEPRVSEAFPHSLALMQVRFTSLPVINSGPHLHPLERAHAGRT
jgi:hypothetical protein